MHSFTYQDLTDSKEWTLIDETQGSDYSGSSVTRSNFEYLRDTYPNSDDLAVITGWFWGYGIAYRTSAYETETLDSNIKEIIDSLSEYPVIDEDHHSRLEIRWQQEAIESWALDDFRRAIESQHDVETSDIGDETMIRIFNACCDDSNTYWESQHADMYIDIERVASSFPDVISSFPVA